MMLRYQIVVWVSFYGALMNTTNAMQARKEKKMLWFLVWIALATTGLYSGVKWFPLTQ